MLSPQTIEELRLIMKEEYGKEMTLAETSDIAYTLVNYFGLLAKMQSNNDKK
jgi:hypothetical protein